MLTVHHLGLSQSERIVWLCEELEIDYQLKLYQRRADNRLAPDAYKALHPMGIAPVITDGAITLGESGAICEYVSRKYGGGRLEPAIDSPDFADHLYWFHWSNATFMAGKLMQLALVMAGGGSEVPGFVTDRDRRAYEMMERRLSEKPFFGGTQLTTADIMMGFPLTTMAKFGSAPPASYPQIDAYVARIQQRPAYRRAMEKAEPELFAQLR